LANFARAGRWTAENDGFNLASRRMHRALMELEPSQFAGEPGSRQEWRSATSMSPGVATRTLALATSLRPDAAN